MLLLGTTDKIQLVTSSTSAIDVSAHFVDSGAPPTPVNPQLTAISSATTTDIVSSPSSGQRNVQTISVRNKGGTTNTVTVLLDRSATDYEIAEATLLTDETLQFLDGVGFSVLDATGAIKTVAASTNPFEGLTGVLRADAGVLGTDSDVTDIVSAASDVLAGKIELATNAETQALTATDRAVTPANLGALNAGDAQEGLIELAIQSEMEAATDAVRAVTPVQMKFHPGVCKGWGKAAGSGSLTTGYNMDAVTDTGTGRLGVNITTDISSVNYAIVAGLAAVATTLTVATIDNGALVYNASQAAGAFGLWTFDHTATTHVVQDPQSYFWAIFGDFA